MYFWLGHEVLFYNTAILQVLCMHACWTTKVCTVFSPFRWTGWNL